MVVFESSGMGTSWWSHLSYTTPVRAPKMNRSVFLWGIYYWRNGMALRWTILLIVVGVLVWSMLNLLHKGKEDVPWSILWDHPQTNLFHLITSLVFFLSLDLKPVPCLIDAWSMFCLGTNLKDLTGKVPSCKDTGPLLVLEQPFRTDSDLGFPTSEW